MKLFAYFISFILNPFIVGLVGAFVLVFRTMGYDSVYALKWTFFSFVFFSICVSFILFGRLKGFFSDIDISNKKERVILYPFLIIVTVLFLISIRIFGGPWILYYAVIGALIGFAIGGLVTPYIKASGHVATITAFVIPFVLRYGGLFYLMLFLIPLVAWARIIEKKHTLPETVVGGIIGGILTIGVYFIVQRLM